ncbi:MAG: cobalamin synthesis protein P47K [Tannerellaceae bacterium]|jgi:Ni2+-binding GTPase involved in maturation of urease and hydrogenase|nr:cobalamin synthesis protein P47K [Tannerellaceae bacterium]
MSATRIIMAGGFLGAGKTTLLWEAARKLKERSLCAGLITNDQAPELVDSALLSREGVKVAEVSGSCFCCNFNGFIHAVESLRSEMEAADVIIAEPVGSCTDLSATILQPLKKFLRNELQVAPLSVLADPVRLASILNGGTAGLHPDAAYIYRKQLEESDIILITKTDLLSPEELAVLKKRTAKAYPEARIIAVSALTGEGLDEWLDDVMKSNGAGLRLADVDYDIYAHGEAVLGWLNGTVRLTAAEEDTDWDGLTYRLLAALSERFDKAGYAVGHVKVIAENGDRYVAGNLTGKASTLAVRGSAGKGKEIKLTINARVETGPGELNEIVRETLDALTGDTLSAETVAWRFLMPGRPQPTHRFVEVV